MSLPLDPPDDESSSSESKTPEGLSEFQKAVEDWMQRRGSDNVEQEEAHAMKLLNLAAEHATDHPSPDDEWYQRIAAAEKELDWEQSISLQREYCTWKLSNDHLGVRWKPLTNLSRLLWMCGRRAEAVKVAEEAVLCGKGSGLSVAPLMTTPLAARYNAALGQLAAAERMVEDALAGVTPEESPGTGVNNRLTLSLRLCRVRLALQRGDLPLVQDQLDSIWPEIEPFGDSSMMAGMRAALAEHADLSAHLHLARGESTAAIEALEKAIHHRQSVLEMPQISERHFVYYTLAGTMLRLAEVMAPSQPDAAAEVKSQANELFLALLVPPSLPD